MSKGFWGLHSEYQLHFHLSTDNEYFRVFIGWEMWQQQRDVSFEEVSKLLVESASQTVTFFFRPAMLVQECLAKTPLASRFGTQQRYRLLKSWRSWWVRCTKERRPLWPAAGASPSSGNPSPSRRTLSRSLLVVWQAVVSARGPVSGPSLKLLKRQLMSSLRFVIRVVLRSCCIKRRLSWHQSELASRTVGLWSSF